MTDIINFKGLKGIKLENDFLCIVILPALGGKIASFCQKEKHFELAFQNPKCHYTLPQAGNSVFEAFDCSGFDDAFPCITASTQVVNTQPILYPDHGEIWSSSFNYTLADNSLHLFYESSLLHYRYEKIFTLSNETLHCHYKIHNISQSAFPYIWTLHALVSLEEDMKIIFPPQTASIENVLASPYLGAAGTLFDYPAAHFKDFSYDFCKMNFFNQRSCEKFYSAHPVNEGLAAIYYPSSQLYYSLQWDKTKLPYLGFWITKGGFKNDYNCALEPSTGYYDCIDIASSRKKINFLQPNELFSFGLSISLSSELFSG